MAQAGAEEVTRFREVECDIIPPVPMLPEIRGLDVFYPIRSAID